MKNLQKLSNKELYRACRECGRNARNWMREFAYLLPEVERRGMHRKYKCTSIYEFAAKLSGMSFEVCKEVLRLSEQLSEMPKVWKCVRKCG